MIGLSSILLLVLKLEWCSFNQLPFGMIGFQKIITRSKRVHCSSNMLNGRHFKMIDRVRLFTNSVEILRRRTCVTIS